MTSRPSSDDQLTNPRRIFILLILYRWISLIPPLVLLVVLLAAGEEWRLSVVALSLAIVSNLLISLYHRPLNRNVTIYPWLIAIDLILVVTVIALSGGWRTPYYLYALSPLLASAFFFQLRGAMIVTTVFVPFFLGAVVAGYRLSGQPPNWLVVVMAVVGFYLISGAMGIAFNLVQSLRLARDELADAHRDLEVIHDLTISLQSAADVNEVEERVLDAVTRELNYSRAVVALVGENTQSITAWMGQSRDEGRWSALPHSAQLPLGNGGGAIGQAMQAGKTQLDVTGPLTPDESINTHLSMERAHIFPLVLRDNPVGVLLVDADQGSETARFQSLQAITNQAAVTLGTTMMCIDRAQRMAVQEERIRIAQDIHDTVSQSLFGIVYTLDGCVKMLPSQPEAVETELRRVLTVAEETRAEVRKSILDIWPSELTADNFVLDLRKYAVGICQADELEITFDVGSDFSRLSALTRRGLYRISQEALANIAHHAAATSAQVRVEMNGDHVTLSIWDNGHGFDPEQALKREYGREHFGLWGMGERANSLGGSFEVNSQPGEGAIVIVDIPL